MALDRFKKKKKGKERKKKKSEYLSLADKYLTKSQIRGVTSLRKAKKQEHLQLRAKGYQKLVKGKKTSINDYKWDDGTDFAQKESEEEITQSQTIFVKKLLRENTIDSSSDLALDEFFDSLFQLQLNSETKSLTVEDLEQIKAIREKNLSITEFLSVDELEQIKAIRKKRAVTNKVRFRKKE
ncbi:MAG: hypothetical protein ACXADY_11370 [Candidatus Hodarchaeales archaeon]|jgi:hypothetical protein